MMDRVSLGMERQMSALTVPGTTRKLPVTHRNCHRYVREFPSIASENTNSSACPLQSEVQRALDDMRSCLGSERLTFRRRPDFSRFRLGTHFRLLAMM